MDSERGKNALAYCKGRQENQVITAVRELLRKNIKNEIRIDLLDHSLRHRTARITSAVIASFMRIDENMNSRLEIQAQNFIFNQVMKVKEYMTNNFFLWIQILQEE